MLTSSQVRIAGTRIVPQGIVSCPLCSGYETKFPPQHYDVDIDPAERSGGGWG